MRAADLLDDLRRRGAVVCRVGDRVRVDAPAGTVPDELRSELRRHKPELLALLSQAASAPRRSTVPHELSLAERVESGYVNPGWTSQAWADRLCQLADRCEALRPEVATQYRLWAMNVRTKKRFA
jgi:hypothetical protein